MTWVLRSLFRPGGNLNHNRDVTACRKVRYGSDSAAIGAPEAQWRIAPRFSVGEAFTNPTSPGGTALMLPTFIRNPGT
jgi:hypothetical protein